MSTAKMLSGVFTVGVWTLLSRVLGFIRDALILSYLGTGPAYQAFVVAFRLPNMFRRFFAEGAFNLAFVPMFSKRLEADDQPGSFASEAFSGLATVLIILTVVAQAIMPWMIYALASGFAGTETFDLSVEFGRIAFPYILFISLAALASGVLNATGRFAAAAAAPVLLNILLVTATLFAAYTGKDVARALIWMIPVAGLAQLVLVWIAAKRAGITLRLQRPRFSPDMKHLVKIAVPAAMAGGVMQINLLVGQQVASYFDRAVGWLFAADRLYQLPLGVVGIAVGIVLLPDLSRRLQSGDDTGARAAFSRATEISLALTIPASVALIVIPLPLVTVLFERGALTSDDSAAIAAAVAIYGLGLPAFVLQKTLQPLFYAREDTKSPFRYALVAMAVNAILAFSLAPVIGWIAPAIATTLASWVMVLLLIKGTRPMGDVARFDSQLKSRIWRICLASIAMGFVLWSLTAALSTFLGMPGWRYPALAALVTIGMGAYFLLAHLLGAMRLSELKGAMRRGR
ncbi:murein biosynthesis integral membrane protein MurJ [Planktotalea sp.]|uniref:murein biosynthesis integral membrane protein MurJ n=1 Tax=Planktotalea sp. TaxID=2029877 RepID=UPI0025D34D5D|nr:murein biosynthesis integral membrane protein MurJ [Planktotalea sp.]